MMGFLRTDINLADTEEEKQARIDLFNRYMECDEWAIRTIPYKRILKLKSPESKRYRKMKPPYDVGVLLTSHPGNRQYLKASVESHKKLGCWLVLAYDNYLDPNNHDITPNDVLPSRDVLDMVDLFLMPHHQTWSGVLFPYTFLLWFGVLALQNFEYIYCTNGDCVLEKPKGFPKLMKLLGDADIMGIGWEENNGRDVFNATAFIAKSEVAMAVANHFKDRMVPFEIFEKHTQEIGNTESRFARAVKDLKLKQVKVPKNPFNTQLHQNGGTWHELVGFSHIHALHSFAYRERLEPPHYKWLDERYAGDEYKRIKGYWNNKKTNPEKAKEFLEEWWPK